MIKLYFLLVSLSFVLLGVMPAALRDVGTNSTVSVQAGSERYKALTVKGTVLDASTRLPIPYANVLVTNSTVGTQANHKGEFTLAVKQEQRNRSIKVSSVGYSTKEYPIAALLEENPGASNLKFFLKPANVNLHTLEVKTKGSKWKTTKVGYNIDQGSSYHHELVPIKNPDTKSSGQEIGNRIRVKKYPAYVESLSFGLTGSGDYGLVAGIHLYALSDDLPGKDLLPENLVVQIPPHHTGWITVKLDQYQIRLDDDVVVVVEWLNEENKLTQNSLLGFASFPKDQITYYRTAKEESWKVLPDRSIGMYVTVSQEK